MICGDSARTMSRVVGTEAPVLSLARGSVR